MKYRKAMLAAGMIDEVTPVAYSVGMGNLATPVAPAVPEKIRTAEAWRQLGARLRELDRDKYEAIFAAIVASLEDSNEVMHESYLLT